VNLHGIFPTPVARFELGRAFTNAEMEFVASQSTYRNMGNSTSDDRYVLKHDSLKDLRVFVEDSVAEYLKAIYAPKEDVSLRITQSWLNYTKPGEFHHKHAHPNSFVSGVLYMKAAKERDRIYFYRDGYQQIKLTAKDWNLYNSESWWFEAVTGELILFPSSLTHMVETVQEDERISLSFNTFPVGLAGSEDSLTALYLEN
jgi:uncharacterized protein (TIGR02466 family)